jgi:hypothetical protein
MKPLYILLYVLFLFGVIVSPFVIDRAGDPLTCTTSPEGSR